MGNVPISVFLFFGINAVKIYFIIIQLSKGNYAQRYAGVTPSAAEGSIHTHFFSAENADSAEIIIQVGGL